MTEKTFAKKVNAQRSAERQAAKTDSLYKVEAVEGGYTVVPVAGDTAPAKASGKGKATTPPPAKAPAGAKAATPAPAKAPRPQAQGKAPADVGKPVRPGTISAQILAQMLAGGFDVDGIGLKACVPPCKAGVRVETQSRIWGLWRSNGIGYSIDAGGCYQAILPANLTRETVFVASKAQKARTSGTT